MSIKPIFFTNESLGGMAPIAGSPSGPPPTINKKPWPKTGLFENNEEDECIVESIHYYTFKELRESVADNALKEGKITKDQAEMYKRWLNLVNMEPDKLEAFLKTDEGKDAGLTPEEAKEMGDIKTGRESAKWIIKMKKLPVDEWGENEWEWCGRQISFISRMRGNKGELYKTDKDGNKIKTRKHTSLLLWGHNPDK